MADFDKEALQYHLSPSAWKRFRDYIIVFCLDGRVSLILFPDYINTLDSMQKIKFTMKVAKPAKYLDFLNLKHK